MGWKSVSPPARASLPFHAGLARSMAEVGSWLGLTKLVLYTITLTRAEIPAHFPCGELNCVGVLASVEALTGARRPFDARNWSGGEFSVKNTSAGERDPSVTI